MSKTDKYKQTVLKDYPIEKAHLSFLNNEYIKWELRCQDGTVLRSNRYFIPEERLVVELKYNYFVIDEVECQENINAAMGRPAGSIQGIQSFQSATKFTNLTRKNVYLLTFPIAKMMIRPREHLRVFTDSVLEYIPILLRQQGTPMKKNDEKLKKYEKSWKTSKNHLYNTIEIGELNRVLEDFDIDKSAISLVYDPVHSMTSVQMFQKGLDPIHSISPDGEVVLDVFQAAHYIFQSLVCGIDWTSENFKNQLDNLKNQILGVMNKYCDVQENLCISKKSIDENMQVVKSDHTFIQHKKPIELWTELNSTDNVSVESVIAFLKSFGISKFTNPNSPLFKMGVCGLSHMGVWMARWMTMDSWIEVFFNKGTEKLKVIVRDSLRVRISKTTQDAINVMLTPIASKLLPSTSRAASSENTTAKYKGSMWNNMGMPLCHIRTLQYNQSKWQLITSDGPFLSSNQLFLVLNINNAWKMDYFILDVEDQKNMEKFLASKNDLPNGERAMLEIECYSNLTKFAKYCPKNIYIRSFYPAKIEQELDLRVFTDDVLEAIPVLLKQQNTPLENSDDRLKNLQEKWKPKASHLYSTIKDSELYQVLEDFDINKEKVTRVPDIVYSQTSGLMRENGSAPAVVYSPKTEVVMDISQALLYTFQSLICGINWKTAQSTDYNDFKKKVMVVLREYMNLNEGTLITKEYVEENIGKLKKHSAYMERMTHIWPDYQMIDKKADDKINLPEMLKIMTGLGLPEGPPGEYDLSIWHCRYFTMTATANDFFDDKLTKMHQLMRGAMIRAIPEKQQNLLLYLHIASEKDVIEEDPVKEDDENVNVDEAKGEEKLETSNTENFENSNSKLLIDSSQSRLDDFDRNLRNAMRKKKEIQKKKINSSQQFPEVPCVPAQKQSDTQPEEASSQKLNEEIARLKEELHQLQVTFDLTKSNIEIELTKKSQEVDDLKKQLEEKNKEIISLQSSNTNHPDNSERLQQELNEMSRINAELRDTNLRVSARNEEQARVIDTLLDRLTRPRTD